MNMNYNKEKFPDDFNQLIQKCENTISIIEERFANKDCIVVKDLYIENKSVRQKDFLDKLQVTYNTKPDAKIKNELQGLYIFGEFNGDGKIIPIYIGISRTVFRRLRQHTWGNKHNEATFAYLKAKTRLGHNKKREKIDIHELKLEQDDIKNYQVIVIPEQNDYDMYFMEVYLSGRLKTKWNSFKTH